MTEIHQALLAFWSQFTWGGSPIPAYLEGHVPSNATFPYFTLSVYVPRAFWSSIVTATVWCRATSGMNVNTQRAAIMESVGKALPEEDLKIDMPSGFAVLRRGSGDLYSYITDPEDSSVIGGRIACELTMYKN